MYPPLSTLHAAALKAASRWPVFPLDGKVPLTARGFKDASQALGAVDIWWSDHPFANVGLPTGAPAGVWVLDLDRGSGKDGLAALGALEARHGALPDTYTVRTGTGGLHLYWRMPPSRDVRNRQAVVPGIDVRGTGGYVVAPPSIHPETKEPYSVVLELEPVEAPPWLVDLVAPPPPPKVKPPPPVALAAGRAAVEVENRLRTDPAARLRAGERLGGIVADASIRGIMCPACSRPSVWWPLSPSKVTSAMCHHRNTCGWMGSISLLLERA
jgi:hypothetical protein